MVACDGLNPNDPGVQLLSQIARKSAAKELLLVHCGDIPGSPSGCTELVLDVREQEGSRHNTLPRSTQPSAKNPAYRTDRKWTTALVWPRAHLGKDFSFSTIAEAGLALAENGEVFCSARKQKGGKSLADFIKKVFGNVKVVARDKGYHLYRAVKGEYFDEPLALETLEQRYTVEDSALDGFSLSTAPGVFARQKLDSGTKSLLEHLGGVEFKQPPTHIVDLCAGVGPLALSAAKRFPESTVLAFDSNFLCGELLAKNAADAGLSDRVRVSTRDGLPESQGDDAIFQGLPRAGHPFFGETDLVLCNPPTHADEKALTRLLTPLKAWLGTKGVAVIVAARPGTCQNVLQGTGAETKTKACEGYSIIEARWGSAKSVGDADAELAKRQLAGVELHGVELTGFDD